MDIELDPQGSPHWLSKCTCYTHPATGNPSTRERKNGCPIHAALVCSCELDRKAYSAHISTFDHATRGKPTYTPIAALCPLHAAAPVLFKALEDILVWADPYAIPGDNTRSYEEARALVQRVREAHA